MMKTIIYYSLTAIFFFCSQYSHAQKKVYAHANGKEYFTIELDTEKDRTWGIYRALNHHDIPYFEMTFFSDIKRTPQQDTVMVIIPTFYTYSYLSHLQGQNDTINAKKQDIKFYFKVENKGKSLTYLTPDSITRSKMMAQWAFEKKKEVDVTSIPSSFVLTKKPNWRKFPRELRVSLTQRLKITRQGAHNYNSDERSKLLPGTKIK